MYNNDSIDGDSNKCLNDTLIHKCIQNSPSLKILHQLNQFSKTLT